MRRGRGLLPEITSLCHRSDERGREEHAEWFYFDVNAYVWPNEEEMLCDFPMDWYGVFAREQPF